MCHIHTKQSQTAMLHILSECMLFFLSENAVLQQELVNGNHNYNECVQNKHNISV